MFSIRVYGLVALLIASAAFVIGQLAPGAGILFVIVATTSWTAYSTLRKRRLAG